MWPIGVIGCTDDRFFPDKELRRDLPGEIPYTTIDTNHVDFLNDRNIRQESTDSTLTSTGIRTNIPRKQSSRNDSS